MGKKLEGNGMWESSRMMLPEHREEILRINKEVFKRVKPIMHQEELEIINRAIAESMQKRSMIKLELFDEYHNRTVQGIVVRVEAYSKRLRLEIGEDYEWIPLGDILKAELAWDLEW